MKLVFACDSFKGSLSSEKTAELLTKAAKEVFGDCDCVGVPTADGGEGTVDAVIAALNGEKVGSVVHDPLMNSIQASYGIAKNKAIIEMAAASGLTRVPETQRNPMNTTTYGTGELIRDALNRGCRELYIAIGGSATNDGGDTVMMNPQIIARQVPYETEESCLSLLGGPRKTIRYKTIKVRYQNSDFVWKTKTYTGFAAQIIQHEADHCDGVLI